MPYTARQMPKDGPVVYCDENWVPDWRRVGGKPGWKDGLAVAERREWCCRCVVKYRVVEEGHTFWSPPLGEPQSSMGRRSCQDQLRRFPRLLEGRGQHRASEP